MHMLLSDRCCRSYGSPHATLARCNLRRVQGAELIVALTHMRTPNDLFLASNVPEIQVSEARMAGQLASWLCALHLLLPLPPLYREGCCALLSGLTSFRTPNHPLDHPPLCLHS